MVMKGYSTLHKAPEQEPLNQKVSFDIQDTRWLSYLLVEMHSPAPADLAVDTEGCELTPSIFLKQPSENIWVLVTLE